MKILDLPQFQRFRDDRFVKVLRHKSTKQDLWMLYRRNKFNLYQNEQSWDVFGKANYIISFIAERHKYAKFVGVWEVINKRKRLNSKGFQYRTKQISGFEELSERLIVKWGDGARSWAQWLHSKGNKEIVEILPPNYVMDFPGYYDFTLTYDDLERMIDNPDSNREWQRMLSSISGIYIILDTKSGKQYVGSAYGRGGIWSRWRSYLKSPSGGNKLLKKLLRNKPKRHRHFQFSILRVLEPGVTKGEVLSQEVCAKKKLGSKAFGLNSN
ncbi:MAG: GIY-YIG nuclease family protein [Planctomycetes bacterium]|nr:GIY-YIG nuclease family protein [Planctomycetota bacterium]